MLTPQPGRQGQRPHHQPLWPYTALEACWALPGLRPGEGLRAKGLHSYLGDVPWGLGREGLVRADSTSVWPRLDTELWADEEK